MFTVKNIIRISTTPNNNELGLLWDDQYSHDDIVTNRSACT